MSPLWDSEQSQHEIVDDGDGIVRCKRCNKRATDESKLSQTICNTDDDRRVGGGRDE